MNDYERKDEEGRVIFKKMCEQQKWCKYKKAAIDKYSQWDVAFNDEKHMVIGEIKYRHQYDSNNFSNWLIEMDKYNSLKALQASYVAKNIDVKIYYINHFRNNYSLIWDLDSINLNDYQIKKVLLQKNDFDEQQVMKDVIYLERYAAKYKIESDEELSVFKKIIEEDEDDLPF